MITTLKRLVFLVTVLGLAACKQASIVTPGQNYVSTDKPPSFEISFTGGIPADLAIQLNTADVTDQFAVTEAGAIADGAALQQHVFSGRNVFRLKANNVVKQAYFYYDTEGPMIHIMDKDAEALTVSGYVSDPAGITSVTLDGAPVTLDSNNSFTTSYVDQPFNTFVAVDTFGQQSTTEFARNDNEFVGISARLNQGGLDFLVSVLREELLKMDFQAIVDGIGEIELIGISPLGLDLFTLGLTVSELSFDDVIIDLDVQDNEFIQAYIYIENLVLGVDLDGAILLIPWGSGVDIQMDELHLNTDLLLDIVDADLDIVLDDTTINHTQPNLDFQYTPQFLDQITSSIVGILAPLFENLFIEILEKIIIPIVSDFIKDIPITLQLITLDDGEELLIEALPEFLDTNDNGITVDLGTRIWAPNPPADIPGALGSLYTEGETPSLGAQTPSGADFDFGASISSNVVNQALLAAHEAGVTTMAISPGFYTHATPEGIAVYSDSDSTEIETADQIGMRIEPSAPPYVKFMAAREDGAAGLFGWHDVTLYFDLYKSEWAEYRTIFGVTFNLEVPFEVNATEDGYLSIGIEKLPTIFVSKVDNSGMILIPPSFINGTLDYFMPAVLPRLAQELKAVPLPRIYNHTLYMEEFWIAGSGENNLSLAGSLIPISVTEAAAEPSTDIQNIETQDATLMVESVNSAGVVSSDAVTVNNAEVTIDIDGLNPNPDLGLLEYRYRVDGGGWSVWKKRDQIHLTRLLAGTHQVEVCSRTVLLKREVSCPVVEFETTVAE